MLITAASDQLAEAVWVAYGGRYDRIAFTHGSREQGFLSAAQMLEGSDFIGKRQQTQHGSRQG